MPAVVLGALAAASGAEWAAPLPRPSASVQVYADQANRWVEGRCEVWVLRGRCQIAQGQVLAQGQEAVLWVLPDDSPDSPAAHASPEVSLDTSPPPRRKVIAYVEGDVRVDYFRDGAAHRQTGQGADTVRDAHWLGRFHTTGEIQVEAPVTGFEPRVKPEIYARGMLARDREFPVQPAQYAAPASPPPAGAAGNWGAAWPGPPAAPPPPGAAPYEVIPAPPPGPATAGPPAAAQPAPTARRVLIRSRSNVRMQSQLFPSPDGRETIAVITSGVNVIVEGIQNVPGMAGDKIDIETDRIVIWTAPLSQLDLSGGSAEQKLQPRDAPLEFYMEGNIVFREGDRVIYAERMYYNVPRRYGMVLNAEVLSPAPGYAGLVRLKANVLQQVDEYNFRAYGAAVTTSRMGVPRYWFQAENVAFQDLQRPRVDPFTGRAVIDPETGEQAVDHRYLASSLNNFVYLGGLPVLYWPFMATDLEKPSFYVDSVTVRNDDVFGFQVMADLDVYQLLGLRSPPEGTDWIFSPGYLSERGVALGSTFRYDRFGALGIPGPVRGVLDAWGIHDTGIDNLGQDRLAVVPDTEQRGRVLWQHRHDLPGGFQVTGEVGWISDRNFLEEYYKQEWDQAKDESTRLELKQYLDSHAWSIGAGVRLNEFFTQTEWLPRADHFLAGCAPLGHFTWFAHTHAGYAQLKTFEPPAAGSEPPQLFMPWETDTGGVPFDQRRGLRAATRQEIDLPLSLGPVKLVPYALGELAYWQENLDGAEVQRAYGQAGVRGSLPFWSVNRNVQCELLNVNGCSHKLTLEGDFAWTDSTEDMTQLPLYDALDDDATEHFQHRFLSNLYGGVLPYQFDARSYAFRSGLQDWVMSPSTEIADDQLVARAAIRQRWQTKRGLPGRERIVDWIVLDVGGSFFPEADRDNFGEVAGLLNYDFRWHLGDRFSLLSDGLADMFPDGLRTFTFGGLMTRPGRGSVYLGYRAIDGPISSNVVLTTINYRLNEKWILNAGAAYDLSEAGNLGETLSLTRIGESMLVRVGFHADHTRDNVGVTFAIEPRFLRSRLSQVGGQPLPPVGAFGVE